MLLRSKVDKGCQDHDCAYDALFTQEVEVYL